eukprot:393415-Rhodomonas_salina.1
MRAAGAETRAVAVSSAGVECGARPSWWCGSGGEAGAGVSLRSRGRCDRRLGGGATGRMGLGEGVFPCLVTLEGAGAFREACLWTGAWGGGSTASANAL